MEAPSQVVPVQTYRVRPPLYLDITTMHQRTQRMPHVLLAVLLAARTYRTSHAHAPTLHGAAKSGDVQGIQALLGARPELKVDLEATQVCPPLMPSAFVSTPP